MGKFKFKVGDKVKTLSGRGVAGVSYVCDMETYCGDIAEITNCRVYGGYEYYRLKNIPYEWHESLLEATKCESKIVITTDGTTTRAAMYDGHKLIREAKAICDKDDVFDFETGAKIAFRRLTNDNEPTQIEELKPLNTKIFVIDGYGDFKSGHIYEIKDGKIIDDGGWRYPFEGDFYNMDDVHKYFNGSNDVKYNSVGETLGGYSTKKQVKVMEVKEE